VADNRNSARTGEYMNTFPTFDRVCVVDGSHGIYVPQRYAVLASSDDMATDEQREILLVGPDHAEYWDVWDEILSSVRVVRGGSEYYLEQEDGDVFLVKATD
jgi:hypothetical protein